MTLSLPADQAFAAMLVFARVGATLMLLPAFGERSIPSRARLGLALGVTLVLAPAVQGGFGALPRTLWSLGFLFLSEIVIGLVLGLAVRLVAGALQAAGAIIALQLGLSFAQAVDPSEGGQEALLGNFLTVLGIVLIFAADLHHLFLAGLHDSYRLFRPAGGLPVGDFAALAVETTAQCFRLALQIFFLAMPANILLGFAILALVLAPAMAWYLGAVEASAARFLVR